MSKHTPGPWLCKSTVGVYAPTGELVASVHTPVFNDSTGEHSNDARLIAAAPDLLKALEALLEVTDFHELYGSRTEAARAAIAKATGEQA